VREEGRRNCADKSRTAEREQSRSDRDERVRVVLCIDEVGRFPTPVLAEINDQGRELGLTVVGAHQYLGQFDDPRSNDRRLRESFLSDTGVKIIFGQLAPEDADVFARLLFEHHLDPDHVQLELRAQRQLSRVVEARSETRGMTQTIMHGRARGRSEAHGLAIGESETVTTSESDSSGTTTGEVHLRAAGASRSISLLYGPDGDDLGQRTLSDGLSLALSDAYSEARTDAHAEGGSISLTNSLVSSHVEGTSEAESEGESRGRSRSVTRGLMVVPTEPFTETSSVQIEPLATQLHRRAAALIAQPAQHAHFVLGKAAPIPFRVADVPDPPFSERQALLCDLDMMNAHPFFSTAEEIDAEIAERQRRLVAEGVSEAFEVLPSVEELQRRLALPEAGEEAQP